MKKLVTGFSLFCVFALFACGGKDDEKKVISELAFNKQIATIVCPKYVKCAGGAASAKEECHQMYSRGSKVLKGDKVDFEACLEVYKALECADIKKLENGIHGICKATIEGYK